MLNFVCYRNEQIIKKFPINELSYITSIISGPNEGQLRVVYRPKKYQVHTIFADKLQIEENESENN